MTLKGHTNWVSSVAFSPDGKWIVSGGGQSPGEIKIWDVEAGEETLSLKGHTTQAICVAFSPDGKRIVSGTSDQVNLGGGVVRSGLTLVADLRLWDAKTGQELLTLKGHTGSVTSVAFSPDGKRIVSSSGDGTLKVWDASMRQEVPEE